jgi:AraC-like DNA-binding protein
MSGDQVLEHLHHDGDPTPVLILTGYPDVASAFQAGRLRAAGYLEKGRLSGAELAVAVRRAAGTVEVRTGKALPLFIAQGLGASPCIAELLRHLDRMEAAAPSGPDNAPVDAQTRLLKVLAQAAANRDLTVLEFTAAANALRLLSSRSLAWSVTVRRIREELAEASRRTAFQLEPKVERVLSHIEAAGSNWSDVTEQQVAAEHDVDVATVWRWLDRQVGLTFPRCRRLVVMRRVVLQLTETDEHVRQIAFRVGYVDHSRLDHEFDASFGLTPTGFRRLQ